MNMIDVMMITDLSRMGTIIDLNISSGKVGIIKLFLNSYLFYEMESVEKFMIEKILPRYFAGYRIVSIENNIMHIEVE